jgi:hypothetical protein
MDLPTLQSECADFMHEASGAMLLKNLPKTYDGFRKVKIRKRNVNEVFVEAFNRSFADHKNLFQRAMFANGASSFVARNDDTEPFYVFPINGYRFIYNPIVTNAFKQYKSDVDYLSKKISRAATVDMFAKVIKQSYVSDDLQHGIQTGAEIIIYGVPYYYAIRKSLLDDFKKIS